MAKKLVQNITAREEDFALTIQHQFLGGIHMAIY